MKVRIIKKPDNILAQGGGINIKESHKGLFTKKAQRAGMSVLQYAQHVLANKDKYPVSTVRQANFARNARSFQHALGGHLYGEGGLVLGGYHTNGLDWGQPGEFRMINNGGTHEENKNEGVPQGVDNLGNPNLVEENEVVYNDYVFSNRLRVPKRRQGKDKEISDLTWEEKMLKPFEGMTYAEAAKKAYQKAQERPNDPIEKRGLEVMLSILAGSQEKTRTIDEYKELQDDITNMSGQEFLLRQELEKQALELALMQLQLMQELQIQLQQMQLPMQYPTQAPMDLVNPMEQLMSPEEMAMMQQQQSLMAALGGRLFANGGFQVGLNPLVLKAFQLIVQQLSLAIALYQQNPTPELEGQALYAYQKLQEAELARLTNQQELFVTQYIQELQELLIQPLVLLPSYSGSNLWSLGGDKTDTPLTSSGIDPVEQWFSFIYSLGIGLDGGDEVLNLMYDIFFGKGAHTKEGYYDKLDKLQLLFRKDPEAFVNKYNQGLQSPSQLATPLETVTPEPVTPQEEVIQQVVTPLVAPQEVAPLVEVPVQLAPILPSIERRIGKVLSEDASKYNVDNSIALRVDRANPTITPLTEKEKKNVKKEVERYYKKRGINPSKLDGEEKALFEIDVQKVIMGRAYNPSYKVNFDSDLAINHESLVDKRTNLTNYSNLAVHDDMIRRGGVKLKTDSKGNILWDKSSPYKAVTWGEDFWKDPKNFIKENGVYNYIPASSSKKFSIEGFNNNDEVRKYYQDKIREFYKSDLYSKSGKYNREISAEGADKDAINAKLYLGGADLRKFVSWLENDTNDHRSLALASTIRNSYVANDGSDIDWEKGAWEIGPGAANITEKEGYSNNEKVGKRGKLAFDNLVGQEHYPIGKDIEESTPASVRRAYIKQGDTKLYVTVPENFDWGDKFEEVNENGMTYYDREITPEELRRKAYKARNGEWYDVTNVEGNFKRASKDSTTDDLGLGLTGVTDYVVDSDYDSTKDNNWPKYELPSKWPFWTGLGINAATALYNILSPVDYSRAEALKATAKNLMANYPRVSFRTIDDKVPYEPLDIAYQTNMITADANAVRRAILNLTNGNQNNAINSLLATAYTTNKGLGEAYREAVKANHDMRLKSAEFNRGTEQFNSEGILKADLANQKAATEASQLGLDATAKAYAMMDAYDANKSNAINASLTGIADNLFKIYQLDYINKQKKFETEAGLWGNLTAAKGGKLITRRKKGLSI